MKNIFCYIALISLVAIGCKESAKKTPQQSVNLPITDTVPFYPYTSEIEKETANLLSNKTVLHQSIFDSANKETKSVIGKEAFLQLAKLFTEKNITEKPLKSYYKESLFTDLTTVSTVMSYSTANDSLPIKNISILLDAKDNSDIKRIDMKVMYAKADSIVTENYAWIFKKGCYINKFIEAKDGKSVSSKIKVSWEKK